MRSLSWFVERCWAWPRSPHGGFTISNRAQTIFRSYLRIPLSRILDHALLCLEVDVRQSKPLAETFRPLEIIQQTPRMISAHVGPLRNALPQRRQILAVIRNAPPIVNRAARIRPVVVRTSALGNLDRRPVVIARNAHHHVIQRLRPDFPTEVSLRSLLPAIHLHRKQPLLR